ncbi:stomatin-like protein 1 isoform X2 [Rhipicephalus microplus]|uniref:stomatin-like protein 1 isoform X2 n=1 Tax=Rhipicephalus microplus TaxID=6941 RepID=UPI003F6BAC49
MRVDIAGGLVEVTMNDFSPYRDSYDTPDFVFDYTSAFDYSSIHHMTALKKPEKYKTIFNYKRRQVVVDLSDCEPEPWQSTIIRTIVTFFCYLFLVFTFPVTCWVCIKRVPSLERIAVFRLGKLQPVQGPVIDSYMKVDLKPKVFEVPAREVLTGDGAIVEVGAELHWQVVHSVRYVTRVKEVDATVGALCQQCLASLLGCSDQDDLDRRREAIEATLLTKLNETILPWGLEVIKVTLKVARVVKTAEPSNPLTPVMSAIKSALGFPSEHAKTQTSMPPRPGGLHAVPACPSEPQFEQLVQVLHQLALFAAQQDEFQGVCATYALQILAGTQDGITVHVCFNQGFSPAQRRDERQRQHRHQCSVELVRGSDLGDRRKADVTLRLSADDLTLILCGKESPMQVYMGGRIQVQGDWSCLRRFMGVIDKCTTG